MAFLRGASALAFIGFLARSGALAQAPELTSAGLPPPTGKLGVGRTTVVCEDSSRIEPLDPVSSPRRILVDVWYPADPPASSTARRTAYLDVAAFERALGADALRKHLGGAYTAIQAGGAIAHGVPGAPFARSVRSAPVLLFSPGGGMIGALYAAQMEELASHGYVVAALTHSYDAFIASFPDGSHIAHDRRRWPQVPSVEGEANLNQLEWHTRDILAVLDYLTQLNGASAPPQLFTGRLDLSRVGAFGHSFGGVAAAHACQKDRRIKACANQDGAMGMKPFYLDARGWGMDQPFLLIERPPNRRALTDEEVAEMKMTRARLTAVVAQLNADRDRALRSTGAGSYRVLLRRDLTTHMDFSDLPVLSARDSADRERRSSILTVVRSYTREFFDTHLRGLKGSLLDRTGMHPLIESVERYAPARPSPGRL